MQWKKGQVSARCVEDTRYFAKDSRLVLTALSAGDGLRGVILACADRRPRGIFSVVVDSSTYITSPLGSMSSIGSSENYTSSGDTLFPIVESSNGPYNGVCNASCTLSRQARALDRMQLTSRSRVVGKPPKFRIDGVRSQ